MINFSNLLYRYIAVHDAPRDPDHIHSEYEILIILDGDDSLRYTIMGEVYPLKPWDMVIIPPTFHHNLIYTPNQYYERILFFFDLPHNDDLDLKELFKKPHIINIENQEYLRNIVSRFLDYSKTFSAQDFDELTKILFSEFLMLLKPLNNSDISNIAASDTNPTLKALLNLIHDNYHQNLPIKFYASSLHLSESYIKNLFSSTMRIGLKHYINNLRILKAQSLIKNGNKPSNIYQQCGFTTYTTFLREYKHFIGINPSDELPY